MTCAVTLASAGEDWVAGHADPALGVVRVVIEPGWSKGLRWSSASRMRLMHVMLYRHVGAGYNNLPAWLREGHRDPCRDLSECGL